MAAGTQEGGGAWKTKLWQSKQDALMSIPVKWGLYYFKLSVRVLFLDVMLNEASRSSTANVK